jgi:hypothetical protein
MIPFLAFNMDEPIQPLDVTSGAAPPSERHEFLADLLKSTSSALVDLMFKQAAVLTLMLGWILSSKEAHEFIHDHPSIRKIAIPAIVLYFILWRIGLGATRSDRTPPTGISLP